MEARTDNTVQPRHSVSPVFLLMVVLPPLATIWLVNRFVPEPSDDTARLSAAVRMRNLKAVRAAVERLRTEHPASLTYHILYAETFFQEDSKDASVSALFEEYAGWLKDSEPNRRDIGRLISALIYIKTGQFVQASAYLQQIENPHRPYVQLFWGQALAGQGHYQAARAALEAEIQNRGSTAAAVKELADLFEKTQDAQSLRQLCENPHLRAFLPAYTVRRLAFRCGQPFVYAAAVFRSFQQAAHPSGIAAAFFILVLWLDFLRRLDLFEPEKVRWVFLTVLMGMAASLLVFPLGDLLAVFFSLGLNVSAGGDLLYCIVVIGLAEEAVKLLPVLVILRFTKEINESIDYLIYASLGALGFAFLENLLYFDRSGMTAVKTRAMICCMGHMFYTSLVMYGVVLARYRRTGSVRRNVLFCFLLASFLHGVYDFFLISRFVWKEARLISVGLVFLEVLLYVRMLNNALNQSEYFDEAQASRLLRLRERLSAGLVGVVMLEYLAAALAVGPSLAYEQFRGTISFTWVLVFFFASALGTYNLQRGFWLPWFRKAEHPTQNLVAGGQP
ncbi:MAG TPA: PrsW family glutamic-type intramembrane protease [Anaerohalosphaeraceae bacterium]|nr:PrsW family glutamic-type intramembrane protease [Anaerohalosphaeraceae bacterium]